ncbi:MAG: hypothetical protein NVV82_22175 [Sporocytophaga sp.]|nr:hypothetical protein [Sporocytophaga sp.]
MKKKKLIIALIKDDLINYRLVEGLSDMGIEASSYFLYLNRSILKLMGFKKKDRTDELYEHYRLLAENVLDLNLSMSHAPLNSLAERIYLEISQYPKSEKTA